MEESDGLLFVRYCRAILFILLHRDIIDNNITIILSRALNLLWLRLVQLISTVTLAIVLDNNTALLPTAVLSVTVLIVMTLLLQ